MSLDIHVSQRETAIVVTLSGAPNAAMLLTLRDALSESLLDVETLVVDIGGLTEVPPRSLDMLLLGLSSAQGRIRIAAGRWFELLPFSHALIQAISVHSSVYDALGAAHPLPPRAGRAGAYLEAG